MKATQARINQTQDLYNSMNFYRVKMGIWNRILKLHSKFYSFSIKYIFMHLCTAKPKNSMTVLELGGKSLYYFL